MKFSQGYARSIPTTLSREIGSKAIQSKRPGTSENLENKQMEGTFSIRKFRLRILVSRGLRPESKAFTGKKKKKLLVIFFKVYV